MSFSFLITGLLTLIVTFDADWLGRPVSMDMRREETLLFNTKPLERGKNSSGPPSPTRYGLPPIAMPPLRRPFELREAEILSAICWASSTVFASESLPRRDSMLAIKAAALDFLSFVLSPENPFQNVVLFTAESLACSLGKRFAITSSTVFLLVGLPPPPPPVATSEIFFAISEILLK